MKQDKKNSKKDDVTPAQHPSPQDSQSTEIVNTNTIQQQNINNQAAPQEEQPAQGGFGGRKLIKIIIFYFIISQIGGLIKSYYFTDTQKLRTDVKRIRNLFEDGQKFSLSVYIDKNQDFQKIKSDPVWIEDDLLYNYNALNERHINVTIPVTKYLLNNGSLWLHALVRSNVTYHQIQPPTNTTNDTNIVAVEEERFDGEFVLGKKLNLISYRPYKESKEVQNLLSSNSTQKNVTKPINKDLYVGYFKPEISVNIIHDSYSYLPNEFDPRFADELIINRYDKYYEPLFDIDEFWLINEYLVPINETLSELQLKLHYNTLWVQKYLLKKQFTQSINQQEQMGLPSGNLDELKRIIMETNIILLTVTSIVTIFHSLFEFLAFKNDIQFWKKADSMKGISVKAVFVETGINLIIFLYLLDTESSLMITIPNGLGVVLSLWKITKATDVTYSLTFPFIKIQNKATYTLSETDKYDKVATTFMSYFLYPIVGCYAIYSLIYNSHKSWYSFVLTILLDVVNVFGFITMTPQIYINYKLQSVEHLPWRALFYKFLNTIIDDLFVFVIKVPMHYRIFCFKDDIIFLIYCYQRWKYRVDKKRSNYYGDQTVEEEEKKEENKAIDDKKND